MTGRRRVELIYYYGLQLVQLFYREQENGNDNVAGGESEYTDGIYGNEDY